MFTKHIEALLLLALFLLPILTPLLSVDSFCAVGLKVECVFRLLSIDAMRSRYFYIFLHIYRTVVAGSEASAWSGRCQRVYTKLSHELNASRYSGLRYVCIVHYIFYSPLLYPLSSSSRLSHPSGRNGPQRDNHFRTWHSPVNRCVSLFIDAQS